MLVYWIVSAFESKAKYFIPPKGKKKKGKKKNHLKYTQHLVINLLKTSVLHLNTEVEQIATT